MLVYIVVCDLTLVQLVCSDSGVNLTYNRGSWLLYTETAQ